MTDVGKLDEQTKDSKTLALSRFLRASYAELGDTREAGPSMFGHIEGLTLDLSGCHLERDQTGWEEGDYPLAWLGGMTGLKALTFTGGLGLGWGTWLSGEVSLPALEELDTSDVNVTDLSILAGFPKLRKLTLDGISLETLAGIEAVQVLEHCEIKCESSFDDLYPLTRLSALHHLDLTLARPKKSAFDIADLAQLTQLTSMTLRNVPPKADLSALRALPGLKLRTF